MHQHVCTRERKRERKRGRNATLRRVYLQSRRVVSRRDSDRYILNARGATSALVSFDRRSRGDSRRSELIYVVRQRALWPRRDVQIASDFSAGADVPCETTGDSIGSALELVRHPRSWRSARNRDGEVSREEIWRNVCQARLSK